MWVVTVPVASEPPIPVPRRVDAAVRRGKSGEGGKEWTFVRPRTGQVSEDLQDQNRGDSHRRWALVVNGEASVPRLSAARVDPPAEPVGLPHARE